MFITYHWFGFYVFLCAFPFVAHQFLSLLASSFFERLRKLTRFLYRLLSCRRLIQPHTPCIRSTPHHKLGKRVAQEWHSGARPCDKAHGLRKPVLSRGTPVRNRVHRGGTRNRVQLCAHCPARERLPGAHDKITQGWNPCALPRAEPCVTVGEPCASLC